MIGKGDQLAREIEKVTGSPEATWDLGRELAATLRAGHVLILTGDLGAGKTALVRGIAAGLGVKGHVSSPTFTILHMHEAGRPGGLALNHFDVYRLSDAQAFYDNGLDELVGQEAVSVLEWGDRVREALPREAIEIKLTFGQEADQRIFKIIYPDQDERGDL